jgi:hypothetical protein
MNLQLTNSFTQAALKAAQGLEKDATSGIPIPEMDGYFVIQKGRKPNGDTIIATLRDLDGIEYDVYVSTQGHA